jgi:serine/threonine-protein kinase HipA
MAFADLDIWMNGQHVGVWYWSRTGVPTLRYDPAWVNSGNARPLSLSLPLPAGDGEISGAAVINYFDNLLPDSDIIRERLHRRFRTPSVRAADLLAAIGRDCVGAVQLVPAGTQPLAHNTIDSTPLSDAQIETLLRGINATTLGDHSPGQDFRISIAGAQEKTALLRFRNRWHLPHGATPTTHIFKLPLGLVGNMQADMSESVENEWLCAKLLTELGFDVAGTEMAQFGGQKVLVVERFDRRWMQDDNGKPSWIARLPQEDFCQAAGWPGAMKYESDGGPGIRAGLALLAGSSQAKADSLRFALTQLAFWLMAATDGHAKNFSIFLERGGGYRLTPLYDVLSAWPIVGTGRSQIAPQQVKLAMALKGKNTHYRLQDIQVRHWQALARLTGASDAFEQMVGLVLQVPYALERVAEQLPQGYPQRVFKTIRAGMTAQAQRFMDSL